MSHYVKVQLNMKDKDVLQAALQKMHIETKLLGNDLVVDKNSKFVQKADGSYQYEGDPYYTQSMKKYYNNEKLLQKDLNTNYAFIDTQQKLDSLNLGFRLSDNSELKADANGLVRVTFTAL